MNSLDHILPSTLHTREPTRTMHPDSVARRFAREIFIVPDAHWRIFHNQFQMEMYELFHRSTICRLGHLLATPTILVGLLMLANHVEIPGTTTTLAPMFIAALVVVALRIDRWVGAAMIPLLGITTFGALRLDASLGTHATSTALTLIVGGTFIQTLSHIGDDVPPPTSRAPGWVPLREWIRTTRVSQLVRIGIFTAVGFTVLELWASVRIWPLQVLHVLMRFGYRPALRRALDERVEEILAHPEVEWRLPRN